MRRLLYGKPGGLAAFVVIASLVAGGLGWATAATLRLEREQLEVRSEKEMMSRLHLALWRLDGRVAPLFTREESRPYSHYSAVYAPSVTLKTDGASWPTGMVLAPSPLLNVAVPEWMLLHFQADEAGWESPQVLAGALRRRLANPRSGVVLTNVTEERRLLLEELEKACPPCRIIEAARERGAVPGVRETTFRPSGEALEGLNNDATSNTLPQGQFNPGATNYPAGDRSGFAGRADIRQRLQKEANPEQTKEQPDVARNNTFNNGSTWMGNNRDPAGSEAIDVLLSPMVPLWLTGEETDPRLLLARLVKIDDKEVCQGIILDWPALQKLLTEEIADLFPDARLEPIAGGETCDPERTMSALSVQLDPGPPADPPSAVGWTPLRVGLAFAWAAALVALGAVCLGGWSLLDLSERRIRFVSAVTHELRTPLTTLRLYLDMLTGGLVRDEAQKEEYLHTLNAEADRLNRLVGNVLDFSRLESQRPRLQKTTVTLAVLLEGVRSTWQGRCQGAGKELIVETSAPAETLIETDVALAQQVLGNLLDNACKYSKAAADARIWVRARREGRGVVIEVEDRGPGVPVRERRSIFRPFRRGDGADVTVGGVGLGLALAQRWASILGGRLGLASRPAEGACFRFELPVEG